MVKLPSRSKEYNFNRDRKGCEGGREHPKSGIFVKVYLRMIRLGSGLLLKTFQVGPKLDSQPSCL
jgi:hypothetical protein